MTTYAKHQQRVLDLLRKLETEARTKFAVDISVEGSFANVLKGCFCKSYEFAIVAHGELNEGLAFFIAPTLRGICEDFIALRYVREKKESAERDRLLLAKALQQTHAAAQNQQMFFRNVRPHQPVFTYHRRPSEPTKGLPPVKNMAAEVNLADIYDFIYAVTSDIVHFNPRIVIRNAWGDSPVFHHSCKNFDLYYQAFCRVYGLYFLCLFVGSFSSDIALSAEFVDSIHKLRESLDEEPRWPEAVTFEEMNIKPPSSFQRLLSGSFHEQK